MDTPNPAGQGIAGHGAFFHEPHLSPEDAKLATAWVRKHVDRRSIDLGERMDDVREHMWELESEVGSQDSPRPWQMRPCLGALAGSGISGAYAKEVVQ
ncbi:MAG: hypothetical protein PHO57_12275 [Acidithiobacillus sp.]|nr:hypothetical protein [Acidithiobacillus sp.]